MPRSDAGSDGGAGADDLVPRIREGDRCAFDELVRSHYAGLCSFVNQLVGSPHVAEDLVQDVFMAVWQRRRDLDAGRSVRAYLYTSARNRARNHLKHLRVVEGSKEEVRAALGLGSRRVTEQDVAFRELVEAVQAAVSKLPERRRLAFTLSRRGGLSNPEIAEVLSISVRTVEAHISAALEFLREELSDFIDAS